MATRNSPRLFALIPRRFVLASLFLLSFSFALAQPASPTAITDQPAWITKSNAHSQVLVDVIAKLSPEFAGRVGVQGYDDKIADFTPGLEERTRSLFTAARDELVKRMASESDPLVRQDLEILIDAANERLETDAINQRLRLPYANIPQLVFFGESSLLDDQVAEARRPAALIRLKRYTGLEAGTKPITELAKDRYNEKVADATLLRPFKGEVESHLEALPRFASGIRQLYIKYGMDKLAGAPAALDALDAQLKDYADWVRATILPTARTDSRLPLELYADNLKNVGLDIAPKELMKKAQLAFAEIRNEMKTLAPLVAQELGFANSDYRAVIRELKKTQITKAEVEPYYHGVMAKLEEIIRREKIVTLPARPMKMRLATDAENANQPAPHFQPPPLVGAKSEQGVFVLTTSNPASDGKQASFDDFTFKAGAWTLSAHEGRPGHDLQFTAMVERGVSLARSLFAFNSVNAEGWALYAEAEMKPYEPLDGQLIALQHRLMRAARAFLDPMINLGQIDRAGALRILTEEICVSEAMANQELDRYTFRMPGQATAYFYGYTRLMELRTATEVTLGTKFDRQSFNDFIIGQGLLPPEVLAKAVREIYIPAQMKQS